VGDEVAENGAARDLILALVHQLERALVGQICERGIAERKRIG
jgi:hypothetical protein